MRKVFVDTAHWIAILHEKDDLHNRAVEVHRKLGSAQFITSELVLGELLNECSSYGTHFRMLAATFVRELLSREDVIVIPQTSDQFESALSIYESFQDKQWGLTDCASYLIMKERKISEALSHDRHFTRWEFLRF